ncbi:MAG: hypothetical protein LC713_02920 [Actinobacteria bacterium]|nr:hypothetical protein [Actinomycetota bacterium]
MAESTRSTAAAKASAQKAATTRKKNATKRSTTAKKAAATRAANRGSAARTTAARKTRTTARTTAARAETQAAKAAAEARHETKSGVRYATDIAEKAVLVPVGATLIARDAISATIDGIRKTYNTRTKASNELRRFERRGSSAFKGIERDAKKARTRVERELREGRASVEKELRARTEGIKTRTEPVVKNAEFVTARVENVVQGGRTAATQASTKVSERIAGLA